MNNRSQSDDQLLLETPKTKDGCLQRNLNELPSQKNGNPDQTTLSLDSLKKTIVDRHRRFNSLGQTLLDYAREAGESLIEVKRRVGHGQFESWLNKNLTDCSTRHARRYMSVAQNWPEIEERLKKEGMLSLTDVADKPKRKSVVHDRFESPGDDDVPGCITDGLRQASGADTDDASSNPGQDKELPIDSDPEIDPCQLERYREIIRHFATLKKTLLPQVKSHLLVLFRLIYPDRHPVRGGFPMEQCDEAVESIFGVVLAWQPQEYCQNCKMAGCQQCSGLGWLRKRQQ